MHSHEFVACFLIESTVNKMSRESKADHPRTHFCSCDLELDSMTLIYEPYLEIGNTLSLHLYHYVHAYASVRSRDC